MGAPGGDWLGARSRSSLVPFVPTYPTERMTFRTISSSSGEVPGLRVGSAEVRVQGVGVGQNIRPQGGETVFSVSTCFGVVTRVEAWAKGGWLAMFV